jgi:hypothetical protein
MTTKPRPPARLVDRIGVGALLTLLTVLSFLAASLTSWLWIRILVLLYGPFQ